MDSILQFREARFYFKRMEEFIKVAKDLAVSEIIEGVENVDAKFQERSH